MVCGKEMSLVTIRFNLVDPVVEVPWSEVKWKSLSHVRLFAIPWTVQSMELARPEYWNGWQADSLPAEPQGKPQSWRFQAPLSTEFPKPEYWSGYSLLQGIFPTQGLNPGLPHCRQILYCLSQKLHIPNLDEFIIKLL